MGGNVRKKTRRKAKVNSTSYSKKLKRKQKKKVVIECDLVRKQWDHTKSLKQNLSDIGFAYDVNKALPITSGEGTVQEEFGDVSEYRSDAVCTERGSEDSEVQVSPEERKTKIHMSASEAKFVAGLIQKYGKNYKDMVRDKSNYNQLTQRQLEKKCEQYELSGHSMKFGQ